MDKSRIDLVQRTWATALEAAPNAGVIFYDKLFARAPKLRPMFRGDLDQQAARLIAMLSVAVKKLDDVPHLLPVLRDMGRRHAGYGVEPEHYADVGHAFLDTLAAALGDAFTREVEDAWTTIYKALSDAMIAGAAVPATEGA